MKVFVAGATGVLGRRLVPLLVAAGHSVTGVARSAAKAERLRGQGAEPVEVDLFDPPAVRAAVDRHDVVVNLATKIPSPAQAAWPRAWEETRRLRSEASRNLVTAALDAQVARYVQESIAFIYPDRGDQWIDEDVPLDAPPFGRANLAAEAQAQRFRDAGRTGVVLRFGQFYAREATHTRYMIRMARRRLPAVPGPKDAYTPAIAAEDAAAAVVAALGVPAGIWNVVDDEPLTRGDFHRMLASLLGTGEPLTTGTLLLRLSANTRFYLRSQRISNRRFTEAAGWAPRYPEVGAGWRAMLAGDPPDQA